MADSSHDNPAVSPVPVSPFDAYQSPPPLEAGRSQGSKSTPQTGGIKPVCIVAIVLGGLGLGSVLLGAVGLWAGQQVQAAFPVGNQPGVPKRVQELQRDMQREMQAVQDRFWTINASLLGIHALVAVGLVAGGIQSLRRIAGGRNLLVAACLAAIAFETARGTVQSLIQVQVMSVMGRFLQEMMQISMNEAAEAAEWVAWGAQAAMVVGVVMTLVWILAKVVFYSVAVWYLRKPAVRQYLDAAQAPDAFG